MVLRLLAFRLRFSVLPFLIILLAALASRIAEKGLEAVVAAEDTALGV